jgi:membrane protein
MDHVHRRVPRPLRHVVDHARGQDILLYAASLAFYAVVSVVPLTILVMWIVSVVLGDQRTQQLADQIRKAAPPSIGADQALERVAQLGSRLGLVSIIAALWPATAYGSGLERAFDRLGPRADRSLEGLRGRGLFLVVILPIFILGSLVGSFLGTVALGSGGVARVIGYVLALATGFLAASICLVLIYRIFPPIRLSWHQILRATAVAAAGSSVLSVLFVLFVAVGANFQEHYATSGLAGLVLLALWLFLSNAMILMGYRVALKS